MYGDRVAYLRADDDKKIGYSNCDTPAFSNHYIVIQFFSIICKTVVLSFSLQNCLEICCNLPREAKKIKNNTIEMKSKLPSNEEKMTSAIRHGIGKV